jgi:hypothetical protein
MERGARADSTSSAGGSALLLDRCSELGNSDGSGRRGRQACCHSYGRPDVGGGDPRNTAGTGPRSADGGISKPVQRSPWSWLETGKAVQKADDDVDHRAGDDAAKKV